jgi:hypothetical protein
MIPFGKAAASLNITGKGEANHLQPELFDARLRTVVRYADPAAWISAAAAAHAVASIQDRLSAVRDAVGVIAVSDEGPQEAMQALNEAALAGFSSPLRFPAGNPGSLVGVHPARLSRPDNEFHHAPAVWRSGGFSFGGRLAAAPRVFVCCHHRLCTPRRRGAVRAFAVAFGRRWHACA